MGSKDKDDVTVLDAVGETEEGEEDIVGEIERERNLYKKDTIEKRKFSAKKQIFSIQRKKTR